MKKLLIAGAAVTGAAFLARRCASSCSGPDFAKMIERMPEDAPPKWMYRNISAIRANTDRILELLDREQPAAEPETIHVAT